MRGISSANNLVAHVEGDIEDVDGVLRITKIRIRFQFTIPPGTRDKADRALETYADKCPAYQTVKSAIECTWTASIDEHDR